LVVTGSRPGQVLFFSFYFSSFHIISYHLFDNVLKGK
jgi:hypothetical protein